MKWLWTILALCVAFLGWPQPAAAQAQQPLEFSVTVTGQVGAVKGSPTDHFLAFSAPVEVPGVGLAPGGYIFRFIAPSVVQVLSSDRSTEYAMFLTVPVSRSEVTNKYVMTLKRIRDDAPVRIASWFMPNSAIGVEPIYRPARGKLIAMK